MEALWKQPPDVLKNILGGRLQQLEKIRPSASQ
jgi:hypothetical protein